MFLLVTLIPACDSSSSAFHMMYSAYSLLAQMVKHLPTMLETQVQSLGREDLLEKGMAIHSSILAWKIPLTEEPGVLQFMEFTKTQTRLSD